MIKMIFKFRITSNEVKLFHRDIQIKSTNNFFDFHDAIQSEVGFDKSQLTSFYLSDDSWSKGREICLFELPGNSLVMDETSLDSQMKKVGQKLIYTFDFKSDRFFMVELIEIAEEDTRKLYPNCFESKGEAPSQVVFKKTETKIQNTFEEEILDEEDDIDLKDMEIEKDTDDDSDEDDEDLGIDEDFLDGVDNFDDENKNLE